MFVESLTEGGEGWTLAINSPDVVLETETSVRYSGGNVRQLGVADGAVRKDNCLEDVVTDGRGGVRLSVLFDC